MSLMAIGLITLKAKRKTPNYLVPEGPSSGWMFSLIKSSSSRRFFSKNVIARRSPLPSSIFWQSMTLFLTFPSNSSKLYSKYSIFSLALVTLSFHSLIWLLDGRFLHQVCKSEGMFTIPKSGTLSFIFCKTKGLRPHPHRTRLFNTNNQHKKYLVLQINAQNM